MITVNVLGVEQKFDFATKEIKNHILLDFGGKVVRAEVQDIDELSTVIGAGLGEPFEAGPPPGAEPMNPPPRPETLFTDEESEVYVQPPVLAPDPPIVIPEALNADLVAAEVVAAAAAGVPVAQPANDPVVEWETLPDEVLPPHFKQAFRQLEFPNKALASKVDELAQSIDETFTEQDWAEVAALQKESEAPQHAVAEAVPAPAPMPAPVAAPAAAPVAAPVVREPQPVQPPPENVVTWDDGRPILGGASKAAKTVQKDSFGYPIVPNAGVDTSHSMPRTGTVDESGIGQF